MSSFPHPADQPRVSSSGPLPRDAAPPGRVPPQNCDLELCVLGGIMLEPQRAYTVAASHVQAESFYLDGHAIIFELMTDLHIRGIPPDAIAVLDELRSRGLLEKVGGSGVVMGMLNAVPTAVNVEHHARLVKEKADDRNLIRGCTMIIDETYKQEMPHAARLGMAQATIYQIADAAVQQAPLQDVGGNVAALMDTALERLDAGQPLIVSYPTGFKALTQLTAGNRPGDLQVKAARPNVGKTRIELYELCSIVHDTNERVGFLSLDMGDERFLTYAAGTIHNLKHPGNPVDLDSLLRPQGSTIGRARLEEVRESARWFGGMFDYVAAAGADLLQIETWVRKMAQRKCRVIAVDQAECISEFNDALKPGRREEINAMLQRLQQMAHKYGVCIHLLHQINRAGTERPTLADLAQSDAFARRPDIVILLHDEQTVYCEQKESPGYVLRDGRAYNARGAQSGEMIYSKAQDCRPVELIVAKNRGPKEAVVVNFDYRRGVLGAGKPGPVTYEVKRSSRVAEQRTPAGPPLSAEDAAADAVFDAVMQPRTVEQRDQYSARDVAQSVTAEVGE